MDERREGWLTAIELLLRQRIGLNPEAFSKNHIRDAVSQRLRASGSTELGDYLKQIRSQQDEFQELVELLVIPESWFFRDLEPFRCLEYFAQTRRQSQQPLRVLSVPCGTGEEPYSIAMTLLNAGFAAGQIVVDAVDISRRVLQQASEGAFGETSFRERQEVVGDFRNRFMQRVNQSLVVNEEVRALVHFRRANVVDSDFLQGEEPYDAIFCRNLLIYLNGDARRLTLVSLHRMLKTDGLLYVGHVEAGSVPHDLFSPYSNTFPFAFQPAASGKSEPERVDFRPPKVVTPLPFPPAVVQPKVPSTRGQTAPLVTDVLVELGKARQAADRGRLAEAESQCLELITKHPPTAEVYCLLGVVRQARSDVSEAAKCFHKALYLDPRHHESLVHAALLARQRGEDQVALNYERRAADLSTPAGLPGR